MPLDLGSEEPLALPIFANNVLGLLLIDSGASAQFVNIEFCKKNNLAIDIKTMPNSLILADGEPSPRGITHTCTLSLQIN